MHKKGLNKVDTGAFTQQRPDVFRSRLMSSPAQPSVFGFMTSGRRRLTFVWLVWMTRVGNRKHVKHSV